MQGRTLYGKKPHLRVPLSSTTLAYDRDRCVYVYHTDTGPTSGILSSTLQQYLNVIKELQINLKGWHES